MKVGDTRRKFRELLAGDRCFSPASVFDPLSARIAESLGYEMGMFAGSIASMTVLGAPDLVLLTLSEFVDQARRICRASPLPLMVDADHGYGNALNAKRAVEELEAAGVAALTIEDTLLPASFGRGEEKSLIPLEEGVGKMRAATAGRDDPDLVIAARTSAISITGLEDTIARGRAYEGAGADAFFVAGLQTREQLEAISSAVGIPLLLGTAGLDLHDPSYLAAHGVRVCFEGHQPFYAALLNLYQTLSALRAGKSPKEIPVAPGDLVQQLTRQADYDRWAKQFL